jgi:8-oxo-dGTP pyrophosphatase MutT (NUDIX family)
MSHRRRATCIVELSDPEGEMSILIAEQHGKGYDMLPGGRVEPGEAPIIAAIRELREETGLRSEGVLKLFEYTSKHQVHHVFYLIPEQGATPQPRSDVKSIWALKHSECADLTHYRKLSRSTVQILTQFMENRDIYLSLRSIEEKAF